jgi:hypothetical protein
MPDHSTHGCRRGLAKFHSMQCQPGPGCTADLAWSQALGADSTSDMVIVASDGLHLRGVAGEVYCQLAGNQERYSPVAKTNMELPGAPSVVSGCGRWRRSALSHVKGTQGIVAQAGRHSRARSSHLGSPPGRRACSCAARWLAQSTRADLAEMW